jgi:opacity protein-like surface antigen
MTMMVLSIIAVRPASADATVFVGADATPANRPVRGFAVGIGLVLVGFEFEYAVTSDDVASGSPSLKTGMGNALVQLPIPIFGFQPYATAGVGVYREELGTREDTDLGVNLGGGVKMGLVGPLKLRIDYRVFRLGNGALYSPAHRVYAGLNLAF